MNEDIGRLLKIASINLSRELDSYTKQFELTGSQMTILDFLARNQGKSIAQKDIEDEFYLKASTISVLLGRLEKKGFIRREMSKGDKRQRCIKLTAKASSLTEIIQEYTRKDHLHLTADLSEQELLIITRFLKKVGGISE